MAASCGKIHNGNYFTFVHQFTGMCVILPVFIYLTTKQTIAQVKPGNCVIVLTTYSQLMSNTHNSGIYKKKTWLGVVLDEGHKIKNNQTQTNRNMHLLRSMWRLVLTGKRDILYTGNSYFITVDGTV